MKKALLIIFIISSLFSFSQKEQTKKVEIFWITDIQQFNNNIDKNYFAYIDSDNIWNSFWTDRSMYQTDNYNIGDLLVVNTISNISNVELIIRIDNELFYNEIIYIGNYKTITHIIQ